MELRDFRKKLDSLDEELVEIISKRMDVCAKIAEFKLQKNISIRDPEREDELIKDRYEKLKSKGIDDEKFVSDLFNLVLSKSRQVQNEKMRAISGN